MQCRPMPHGPLNRPDDSPSRQLDEVVLYDHLGPVSLGGQRLVSRLDARFHRSFLDRFKTKEIG